MVFPVLLDTNVLFGGYLCDTMLRLAEAELFRPLWSEGVLDELTRNLIIRRSWVQAPPAPHSVTCTDTPELLGVV